VIWVLLQLDDSSTTGCPSRVIWLPLWLSPKAVPYSVTGVPGWHCERQENRVCAVLVLDDLGAEKLTEWGEEPLYLLIDYRYRQRLPVFASSNVRKEALAERLDRRVLDRVRETCTMLEVVGPNRRDRAVQRGPASRGTP